MRSPGQRGSGPRLAFKAERFTGHATAPQDAADNMGVADLRVYCSSESGVWGQVELLNLVISECPLQEGAGMRRNCFQGCQSSIDCSQICSNAQKGIKLVKHEPESLFQLAAGLGSSCSHRCRACRKAAGNE